MSRTFNSSKTQRSPARLLAGAATLPSSRFARGSSAGPTILLVDDDHGVLVSLARVLSSEGWHVVTASNGEEALQRLAEQQPDLMITDLSMGAVSGWDLLFHENLQRPDLPIFVITALPPSEVGGADRFATEFFQKPLDLEALMAAIHQRVETFPSMQVPH
jgi:DNA-binding response OmpR family regulator